MGLMSMIFGAMRARRFGLWGWGGGQRYIPVFDVDNGLGRLLGGIRIVSYIPYCLEIVDVYLSQARYHVTVHVTSQS